MQNLINGLRTALTRIDRDQRGATMVEYGIMVALIAVVAIAAVTFLGNSTCETFDSVGNELTTATQSGTTPADNC